MFFIFEVAAKSWESPASQSTTSIPETRCQASAQNPVLERSASSVLMHSPFIWSVMSHSRDMSECPGLNGGKASDWLRLYRMTSGWCLIRRVVFDDLALTT